MHKSRRRVGQRNVHHPSLSGAGALVHGGENAHHGKEGAAHIRQLSSGNARARGIPQHAGAGLVAQVMPCAQAVRPRLPEARQCAHHQAGAGLEECLVAKPEALQHPGAEALTRTS